MNKEFKKSVIRKSLLYNYYFGFSKLNYCNSIKLDKTSLVNYTSLTITDFS